MSESRAALHSKLEHMRGVLKRTHEHFDRERTSSRADHGTDLAEVIERMNAWVAEAEHAVEHGDADAHETLSQRGDELMERYDTHRGDGPPSKAPAP